MIMKLLLRYDAPEGLVRVVLRTQIKHNIARQGSKRRQLASIVAVFVNLTTEFVLRVHEEPGV